MSLPESYVTVVKRNAPLLFGLLDTIAAREGCGGTDYYVLNGGWAGRLADFERELVGLSPGQLGVLGAFFPDGKSTLCRDYVTRDFYAMLLEFTDGEMG